MHLRSARTTHRYSTYFEASCSSILGTMKFLSIGHPIFCATLSGTSGEHLLQLFKFLSQLTRVGTQRCYLEIPLLRDIDRKIWVRCAYKIDFSHFMREQAFFQQIGKIPSIL